MLDVATEDVRAAMRLVERLAGLEIPEERAGDVATALRQRAEATGARAVGSYLAELESRADGEIEQLTDALAVHETYFFRDPDQLDVVVDHAIPDRAMMTDHVRVLSAGTSTGAEAYSVAILVRERAPHLASRVDVVGVDVSRAAIDAARRGRYAPWALRASPPEIVKRWFHPRGHAREVSGEVRARVSFEVKNLLGAAEISPPGAFDVILCRNVIMYLSRRAAEALVARLERSLAAGGYLFLGHAETLRGFDTSLVGERAGDLCCFYRRPIVEAPSAERPAASRARVADHAARRAPPRRAITTRRGREDTERAALVQRAIALVDRGDLARAEEACARAAEADEMDAAPRYLTALCRHRAGDLEGAIRHHTAAACLDPTFAMPCLHLAMLRHRAGDPRAARR